MNAFVPGALFYTLRATGTFGLRLLVYFLSVKNSFASRKLTLIYCGNPFGDFKINFGWISTYFGIWQPSHCFSVPAGILLQNGVPT